MASSKDGPNRKCEEQNNFHWRGERSGGRRRLREAHTPPASHLAAPVVGVSFSTVRGISLVWNTLLQRMRSSSAEQQEQAGASKIEPCIISHQLLTASNDSKSQTVRLGNICQNFSVNIFAFRGLACGIVCSARAMPCLGLCHCATRRSVL